MSIIPIKSMIVSIVGKFFNKKLKSISTICKDTMTDAKFCDVHPDQATSLIRVQSGQRSFYTLQLGYDMIEKNTEGKKTRWSVNSKYLHICAKCAADLVLKRAQALGVEVEWNDAYRLVRGNDGKYKRVVKSGEEEQPIEA